MIVKGNGDLTNKRVSLNVNQEKNWNMLVPYMGIMLFWAMDLKKDSCLFFWGFLYVIFRW